MVDPLPDDDPDRDVVDLLADDFLARSRRGEAPDVEEYVIRCPERADEIREIFPTIVAMERWKPRPSPPANRPGSAFPASGRLGDLRLIREIGRGGMGVVYEAEQESLDRRVAVKVLPHAPWTDDDRSIRRFLREAKTTANLRHGNIVPVFAVGREGDLHYYVMPLIAGAGLDHVLRELRRRGDVPIDGAGRLAQTLLDGTFAEEYAPPTRADHTPNTAQPVVEVVPQRTCTLGPAYWRCVARIGRQAAEALQHAHDQGVLHRDVKPANLLLDTEGVVWVADFGLAKAAHHDDLSRPGDLLGTLRYMPPERFRGESDARGDIYSLGLTLYELLTLRPAYDAADRAEAFQKIGGAPPPNPRSIDPGIPRDLETIVLKAIEAEPADRYQSARAMAEDLQRFDEGRSILARRDSRIGHARRWVRQNRPMATLGAFTIVLGLVATFFIVLFIRAPRRPFRPDDPNRPFDEPPFDDRPPGPRPFGPPPFAPPRPNPRPMR